MANVSTRDLLSAPVVTKVISTIATPQQRIQNFLGLNPGSASIEDVGGHSFSWDIYEHSRQLANFRAPSSGPGTRKPTPIGHVQARIPRLHEKVVLNDEMLFRNRRLGGNPNEIDRSGQQYVYKEQRQIAQRFRNSREFLCRSILKGGCGVLLSGEDWVPVNTGAGTFDIDFQVPAGNKNQLDMLGDGAIIDATWATASTDIVTHCIKINEAHQRLHGRPLEHAWIRSGTFNSRVLQNDKIKAAAGTANIVWKSWERSTYVDPVYGVKDAGFDVVLHALPWLVWHLYDGVLDVNGTITPLITADHVHFLPSPDPSWIGGANGSEMVRENVTAAADERYGLQAWTEPCTQPSGFELLSVDNFLPTLYVPSCVTDATIVGF